mmetsp:Transcript_22726/g.65396  ORF Transcript_22726/g.65396 Transcript_22726/m.65396 type:complete len:675 (+) Transcript_22726:76-2100(+)
MQSASFIDGSSLGAEGGVEGESPERATPESIAAVLAATAASLRTPADVPKEDVELAPLVREEALAPLQVQGLDPGPIDYLVRCVGGRFADRFVHVNRKSGELFGTEEGGPEVTMCIEDAGLSSQHACIMFDHDSYQYFLEDVGSEDGTWLVVRWRRSVALQGDQVLRAGNAPLLEITQGPLIPEEEEVSMFLAVYQLQYLARSFMENGLRSLDDIRKAKARGTSIVEMMSGDLTEAGDQMVLAMALDELDRHLSPEVHERHMIRIVMRPSTGLEPIEVCRCGWAGGLVALAPDGSPSEIPAAQEPPPGPLSQSEGDQVLGVVPGTGWQRWEYLKLGYSNGAYYVHLRDHRDRSSPERCFIRLGRGQRHWLQPQDVFRIGQLEFEVLRFNVGVHSEQGKRPTMEDEEVVVQDLTLSHWRNSSFFAIYDGHGGRECVQFLRLNLHRHLVESLARKGGLDSSTQVFHDIHECIKTSFLDLDVRYLDLARSGRDGHECGSTAVVVCIIGAWLWCANVGDSRAVLCREGKAVLLSSDHRPSREDEAARVEAAGGFVTFGRVMGRLALTRAFGDLDCKTAPSLTGSGTGENMIIADPEIRLERVTPQDELLLLACDGLFDVFSTQEAIDFARAHLAAMPPGEQDPKSAAQALVHEAIHERGSRDNVTAMIVSFRRGIVCS